MSQTILLDPTLGSNGLGSFLGGDRGETLVGLLRQEDASKLTRPALKELAEAALDGPADSVLETMNWAQFYAVVGDFPPYEELNGRVVEAIQRTDFVALAGRDVLLGLSALRVASLQAHHLGNEELHLRLKADVLKLAEYLAGQHGYEAQFPESTEVHYLIESALHLAVAAAPITNVFTELAEVLAQLTKTWTSTATVCEGVVQRFVEELPVTQGRHFWPLRVRLRAERP
jgi:hypothetical protein